MASPEAPTLVRANGATDAGLPYGFANGWLHCSILIFSGFLLVLIKFFFQRFFLLFQAYLESAQRLKHRIHRLAEVLFHGDDARSHLFFAVTGYFADGKLRRLHQSD